MSGTMGATQSKFVGTSRARKEVEANPFKTLVDLTDVVEGEANPAEVLKDVQNTLLFYNSDLKTWYKTYARKVEAQKSEESFAMTLRNFTNLI